MLMHRGHIGWTSLKLITRVINYIGNLVQEERGKFGWNGGGIAVLSRKPAISLKLSKIGPRLLLMTNRKLHTRYQLVPKSITLDDLEWPFCTLFQNTCIFGAHHENLNEDRPILSAAKMYRSDCNFWHYKVYVDIYGGSLETRRQTIAGNRKRWFSALSDATSPAA